jgi:hypothetical protein
MTDIRITLKCGHENTWEDNEYMPGADLPWVGRETWCYECLIKSEITECNLANLRMETVEIGNELDTQIHTFFSTNDGTWGYAISSQKNGIWGESDDVTGFEDRDAALANAKASIEEQRKIDAEYHEMERNTSN